MEVKCYTLLMPMREGQPQLSGFINVNKPVGFTSFDVIRRLRSILRIRKLGHSGVLDKPATGVLPIGVNRATKLFQYFDRMLKVYLTTFLFGFSTDTDDITGRILSVGDAGSTEKLAQGDLEAALAQFKGDISQVPPRFSTTKVHGKEFYRLTLQGQEVPRRLKRVTVEDFEVLDFKEGPEATTLLAEHSQLAVPRKDNGSSPLIEASAIPELKLLTVRILCRGGFYVRSLARDVGELVKAQGCVLSLVREQVGPFRVEDAVGFDEVEQAVSESKFQERVLLPMRVIAEPERTVKLDAASIQRLRQGQQVLLQMSFLPERLRRRGEAVFVLDSRGHLAAVAHTREPVPGERIPLQPARLLR